MVSDESISLTKVVLSSSFALSMVYTKDELLLWLCRFGPEVAIAEYGRTLN
jgi:hypothetical protein